MQKPQRIIKVDLCYITDGLRHAKGSIFLQMPEAYL